MPEVPVKVFVRVRPLLDEEKLRSHALAVNCVGKDQLVVGGDRLFRFDRVFPPSSTQDEVYTAVVSPLVQSFIAGFNCTVFAYGQTSSGKTYTLGSDTLTPLSRDSCGIIYRAVEEIFSTLNEQGVIGDRGEGGRSEVRVSYIEVYKEEVRELISEGSSSPYLNIVHIREDEAGHTVVAGVTEEVVSSVEDAISWLETGSVARVTSATAMNEHSSRSHAIFTITLEQQHVIEQDAQDCDGGDHPPTVCSRVVSKFHFVDLAGSERVNRTENKGERFRESVHINGGLLALGNVISALADPRRRGGHIPYRDSKITRLLKDSLGGSARTVMITCLSPAGENVGESLNALKYAKRARSIKNRPVVNRDPQSTIMDAMKKEIYSLREKLDHYQRSSTVTLAPSTIDSGRSRLELPALEEHIQSLKEELELSHTHQQELQSKLGTARDQLVALFNSDSLNPGSRSALVSVLAVLERALQGDTTTTDQKDTDHENRTSEKRLSYAMHTIELLRRELELCKRDLKSDEDIFAEKMSQLDELKGRNEVVTARRDEVEEEIEAMREREGQLHTLLEERTHTITELKHRLHDVNEQLTHHPTVSSVEVQTETGSDVINETTPPARYAREGAVGDDDDQASAMLHLLQGAVEVTSPQDLSKEYCDTALRRLTSILAEHALDVTACSEEPLVEDQDPQSLGEEEELRASVMVSAQAIQHTERRLLLVQQELHSMTLKIRLKEELIRELVKNGNTVQQVNKSFRKKISSLEEEARQLREQLKQAHHGEVEEEGGRAGSRRSRHVDAHKQKLVATELKLKQVEQQQKEMQRLLRMRGKVEQRVVKLEGDTERLRNERERLKRDLKKQGEKKSQLENEVEQCRHRLADLELCSDQQKKVLKVKTAEAAAAQRKLRQLNTKPVSQTPVDSMGEKQTWLDAEVEKVLEQKNALAVLEKELAEREAMINEQESLIKERALLERRKVHSRQQASRELNHASTKISSMDTTIDKKEKLRESVDSDSGSIERELEQLKTERQQLCQKRDEVSKSIGRDHLLSSEEETRLVELSEQIEVMESVIQLRGSSLNHSLNLSDHLKTRSDRLHQKLVLLSAAEARSLLLQYVDKVIALKAVENRQQGEVEELRVRLGREREKALVLEQSVKKMRLERELKTTKMSKDHEQQIQILLGQITSCSELATSHQQTPASELITLQSKIKALERDLYYYKKTSRDLKQQLHSSRAPLKDGTQLQDSLDGANQS